ncbi:MAG TPA: (2Fe-2S)-binding protein [Rhodobacteraceae bacterium]|jgi:phenylpropionate dioxygenase-like ring-hydroxylating dioxygenase large terminal subunit|nr:(2Fe-2S)-binding protein [Paracoccaceae bacterium]
MTAGIADHWYPVAMCSGISSPRDTRLLGQEITIGREGEQFWVRDVHGKTLPAIARYGHLWTSPGQPNRDLFSIPEAEAPGRRLVDCGAVRVKCSPLRAVENFLDIAHFPFVHTDILGAEPYTEVSRYDVQIREEVDEVWATKVKFFQPQAARSAAGGITTEYMYRVAAPTSAVLYKTCPPRPGEWDIITLFVQPLTEELCDVWPWMALYDDTSPLAELVSFQQMIFMQDRSILESQIPRKLPLDPGMEAPTQADLTSVAYRRWLKRIGFTYGAQVVAA